MEKLKVSVIIPVYNVEKYLRECVDSVINQTYKNLEIILVDDGSPDNCGKICDEYAEIDSRVKVIHKQNGGASSARNSGIEIASGEYIGFVDGDDVIESDMYEFLLNLLVDCGADIARCGMARESNGKRDVWGDDNSTVIVRNNQEGICDVGEANGILPVSPCNKLYKAEVVNSLRFDDRFVYAEDTLFNYYAACKSEKTVICDKIKYHYIANPDSASHKVFCKERFDEHKVTDIIMDEQKSNPITYKYCLKGDVMKSFRTIKEMTLSGNETEDFNKIRKRITKHKKEIFTQKIYSKTSKFKTLLLWIFPWGYRQYIKITRG